MVDQGSANGSFVDGKRVGEAALRDGQRLRLGSVELRVEIEPDVPETVLIAPSAPDEDATVLMKTPEEAPPITSVEIRVPVLAPPAPLTRPRRPRRPSATRGRPRRRRRPVVRAAARRRRAPRRRPPGDPLGAVRPRRRRAGRGGERALPRARAGAAGQARQRAHAGAARAPTRGTSRPSSAPFARSAPSPPATTCCTTSRRPSRPWTPTRSRRARAGRPPPSSRRCRARPAPAKGRAALLPPATTILAFLATGLLALSAFFALSSSKLEQEIRKEEEAPELVAARQAAAKYQGAEELLKGGALRNGRLRLCNRSGRPLEIDWLAVVYLQKEELPRERRCRAGRPRQRLQGRHLQQRLLPPRLQAHPRARRGAGRHLRLAGRALPLRRRGALLRAVAAASGRAGAGGALPAKRSVPAPEAAEKKPGEPGTTYWQSGLLGGRDDCVSVGAGW